jgi:hypothetical protein
MILLFVATGLFVIPGSIGVQSRLKEYKQPEGERQLYEARRSNSNRLLNEIAALWSRR